MIIKFYSSIKINYVVVLFFYLSAVFNQISSTTSLSNDENTCRKYKEIKFFSEEEQAKRIPSLLYTFPGSGNNWLELLVEHATGIRTGSVYPDKYLIKTLLPGYFHCDRSVSLVLMHTVHHFGKDIEKGIVSNLCLKNNITRFGKVVMLYRNPFDAIWNDFQRQATEHTNNHTGVISYSRFRTIAPVWQRFTVRMAHMYASMIDKHYPIMESMYGQGNYMYIRYEDLINHDLREGILDQLVSFLGLSSSPERIKCAFSLSDKSPVHRVITEGVVTKDTVYGAVYGHKVVCDMWTIFQQVSNFTNYKYSLPTFWAKQRC